MKHVSYKLLPKNLLLLENHCLLSFSNENRSNMCQGIVNLVNEQDKTYLIVLYIITMRCKFFQIDISYLVNNQNYGVLMA